MSDLNNAYSQYVNHIALLAKEVGYSDFIETPVGLDKDELYKKAAQAVITEYLSHSDATKRDVMLSSLVHLVVENTILNHNLLYNRGE